MSHFNLIEGWDGNPSTATYDFVDTSQGNLVVPYDFSMLPTLPYTQKVVNHPPSLVVTGSTPNPFSAGMSWGDAKRGNLIKMTDYEVSKYRFEWNVIKLPHEAAKIILPSIYQQQIEWLPGQDLEWAVRYYNVQGMEFDVPEVRDAPYFGPDDTEYNNILQDRQDAIQSDIEEVKRIVIADSYQTWDALTSAAELSKALKLFTQLLKSAVNPLRTISKTLSKARDKKEYADKWLGFRYGIMPTIYEIQDIMKLIQERGYAFKTSRSSRTRQHVLNTKPPGDARGMKHFVFTWDDRIAAVGKARFGSSSLRALDQISINPFLTGWELIPFSFVVDWFVNVGDFIQAQSLSLSDQSDQRLFCYSVKSTMNRRYLYRRQYVANVQTPVQNPLEPGAWFSWTPMTDHSDHLITEYTTEDYKRRLFHPSDAKLRWKPNLNWARFLDSIALATRSSTSAIGNLRL